MTGPTVALGPDERLLTPSEVAALFGVKPLVVGKWARAGRLPWVWTPGGTHRRYREADVLALRDSLTSEQTVPPGTWALGRKCPCGRLATICKGSCGSAS